MIIEHIKFRVSKFQEYPAFEFNKTQICGHSHIYNTYIHVFINICVHMHMNIHRNILSTLFLKEW